MKKSRKKALLSVVSMVFAVACVGTVASYNTKVNAATPLFEMKKGASVRTSADTPGIRFSFTVDETQETALSAYKTVEYGMLITQTSEVADINTLYNAGASIFTSDTYTFDKDEHKAHPEKIMLANITGSTLTDGKDEDAGKKVFNAALTNISTENFTVTYMGVGYIKTTDSENNVAYHFAENNENVRTITYVAEAAIVANDPNAVGNTVAKNYVNGGYSNLGLTGTGTEESPYIVTESNYEALKGATENKLIYGAGKCMKFANGVDYSNLATDFADRKYSFVWESADPTLLEVENFNAPSKVAAAYANPNTAWSATKSIKNATAVYHDEFEDRTGVISLKAASYYESPADPWKADGWSYYFCSKSGFTQASFGPANEENDYLDAYIASKDRWDYVSAWIYIEGEENETVTLQAYNNGFATYENVPCNEWYEYKVERVKLVDTYIGHASQEPYYRGWFDYNVWREALPLFIINDTTDRTFDTTSDENGLYPVQKDANNRTVYIDRISYEKDYTVSVAKEGMQAVITTSRNQADSTITVKANGNDVTVTDGKFDLVLGNVYTVTATAFINEEQRTATCTYSYTLDDVMPANEIEGFYNADSVNAAYGVKEGTTTLDKTTHNDTAAWVASKEDKNGVIKEGVLSLNKTFTHSSGAAYALMSTVRNSDFYGASTVNQWKNDTRWDYLSIWMYIEKPEGETAETTTICRVWGRATVTVPFDTWFEYKLTKEALSNDMSRPFATLSGSQGTNTSNSAYNGWNVPLFYLGGDKYQGDYKVFVDSISYEKHDVFEVTATQNEQTHEITVTINPNEGITLADFSDINYRIVFRGNEQAKNIQTGTTEALSFTFTPNPYEDRWFTDNPSTTETYGICVTLTYNDVKYTGYYNISGVTYAQQTAE